MKSEELLDLIKLRRSVRIFTGIKVPEKTIHQIIEAGTWAPTGCNMQELRFLVLDKPKEMDQILRFKPFFQGVSHYVIVLADMSLPQSIERYVKHRHEWRLPFLDGGLALQNMALEAKAMGVDTCVFNLSEIHFAKPEPTNFMGKIIRALKLKFNFRLTSLENSFEHTLRHELNVPKHLKPIAALALGYAKFYPDPKTIYHGKRLLDRKPVGHYIVNK